MFGVWFAAYGVRTVSKRLNAQTCIPNPHAQICNSHLWFATRICILYLYFEFTHADSRFVSVILIHTPRLLFCICISISHTQIHNSHLRLLIHMVRFVLCTCNPNPHVQIHNSQIWELQPPAGRLMPTACLWVVFPLSVSTSCCLWVRIVLRPFWRWAETNVLIGWGICRSKWLTEWWRSAFSQS